MGFSISFVFITVSEFYIEFIFRLLMFILHVHNRSPLAQMEEERREHVAKMKKMEMEMEQVFEMKVKEKVQKLKDSEAEVISLTFSHLIDTLFLFKVIISSIV